MDDQPPPFIPLHTHSYYSFLAGVPSPEELVEIAQTHGMDALALTDLHSLTGAVIFYEACQQAGIKPILGLELVVNHRLGRGSLVFLAMDRRGWRSLCRLSSLVQTNPKRDPWLGVEFEVLVDESEGIICLTGGLDGLLYNICDLRDQKAAVRCLDELKNIFGDRLYLELVIQGDTESKCLALMTHLARKTETPILAANPVYYLQPDGARLQGTLTAIRLNCQVSDLPTDASAPPGSTFPSPKEIETRFVDLPEAIQNTREVADRCNLDLPLGVPLYPEIALPEGITPDKRLRTLAEAGARKHYGVLTAEIQTRLDTELAVITDRAYAPLFLIVREILEFARDTGVPISSRGSAASSLVAYCLGITSPDPIALNLYFERFLNPARATPPDIDTDICSNRRDSVLNHVYEHYGQDRVAMVATINRFRPRSALREIAKAYGLTTPEIKELVDALPRRGWGSPSRRGSGGDPFEALDARFPDATYQTIFREARSILKYPRHLSVHPGGMVITPAPMTDLVPTHLASKGIIIAQFDLKSIERMGLVKIDLLGTRGLTVIGDVAEKIRTWQSTEYRTGLEVLEAIPEDDPETSELLQEGQTIGCFQIESPGMRSTLREINARSPDDLMVALALYRPGPMTGGLKSAFVRRHLGQEDVEHIHPALSSLLADTYGVILYQEQVLLIASHLAGLSLADADLLRRAMSHFDPGERMKSLKRRFVRGSKEINDVPEEVGAQIWDLMAAFAGYGFPKAHAASYATVSWRSAWCKRHYPAEFMGAVLAGWGGYYRQRVYLNEARRLRLQLCAPHINHAQRQFCVTYPKGIPRLYMGLDQVRNLTRKTQTRILCGRPFHSLDDFLTRVDPRPVEAKNLVKIGALNELGTIPALLARLELGGWAYAQPPLFSLETPANQPNWDLSQRVDAQISVLGTSVEAHPLELYTAQIKAVDAVSTSQALNKTGETLSVVGLRQTTQRFFAHDGDPYHILELEDLEGVLPVRMAPPFYHAHREILSSRKPFIVEGEMAEAQGTGEPVLMASRIVPL